MKFIWIHSLLTPLSVLLTLLFVSSILRSKRAAGSTIAWLLLICVFPYIGIPIYLFLSTRKVKGNSSSAINTTTSARDKVKVQELTPIERILSASGSPSVKKNASIELLTTGILAFGTIEKMIATAKDTIYITTFIFGDDPVGIAMENALAKKASEGVDVRVIVDSLGATLIRHPSFQRLLKNGGKIAYFMPVFHLPFRGRTNLRNHRKLIVVDGKNAILGGMNLAQEYLGPTANTKQWVDLSVQITGDCVNDIQSTFLKDWAYVSHHPSSEIPSPLKSSSSGEILAQVVASGPDVHEDTIYDVLISSIYAAKKSIQVITPYFIPDESLTKALQLAAKRGVAIQIVIPKRSNHRLADFARGSFIRQLDENGVKICFFPRMIHAKAVMIDRSVAILGSANFDMRSLLLNYELGLIIYSEKTLQDVEKWIDALISETSSGISRPSFIRELCEGIGRVIGPIL